MRRARDMDGGSSTTMTALEIVRADGSCRTAILRRCGPANLEANPDSAADEHRLLGLLHAQGLPVPRAFHCDRTRELVGTPFLVIDFLDGTPDHAPKDPVDAARQMAEFMADLHAVDPAGGFAFMAGRKPVIGPHAIARNSLPERFRDALASLLAAWPGESANRACVLHGDFWPGNLLWRDGRLLAVVDWEDAGLGDPMIDVAIARVDLSWSFGFEAVDAFTSRYAERTGFDLAPLPLWDLAAVLRQVPEAAVYAEGWQELGRRDITEDLVGNCHEAIAARATEALRRRACQDRDAPAPDGDSVAAGPTTSGVPSSGRRTGIP